MENPLDNPAQEVNGSWPLRPISRTRSVFRRAFGTLFLAMGLGLSGYMNFTIALFFLIAYFLMSIQSYLATHVFQVFQISLWKLSPTEIRIAIIAGNTYVFFRPEVNLMGWSCRIFDLGALISIAGMLLMLIYATIRNTARLYREEKL